MLAPTLPFRSWQQTWLALPYLISWPARPFDYVAMPVIAADAYHAAVAFIDGAKEATHEQRATSHDNHHGLCVAYAPHFVA